jgi:hypothetical protein
MTRRTITTCDQCGREFEPITFEECSSVILTLQHKQYGGQQFDLCPECSKPWFKKAEDRFSTAETGLRTDEFRVDQTIEIEFHQFGKQMRLQVSTQEVRRRDSTLLNVHVLIRIPEAPFLPTLSLTSEEAKKFGEAIRNIADLAIFKASSEGSKVVNR